MIDNTQIIISLIEPLFGLLTLMATGGIAYLGLKINKKVDSAKKVNDATHTLVNSNMGVQLKIAMGLAARVAELTGHKDDYADAVQTKKLYDDHMKKQALVDLEKNKT